MRKNWTKLVLASLFLLIMVGSCKKDTYNEIPGLCPEVTLTSPASDAINVSLDKIIDVTFNDEMNPATITADAFVLTGPSTKSGLLIADSIITGNVTYNELTKTMSFKPTANLKPNTLYTGRVKTLIKNLRGVALQTDYIWKFTTGVPPIVIATYPVAAATGIPINAKLTAIFSTRMDSLTFTPATFTLKQGNLDISGTILSSGSKATFKPTSQLTANTVYTATITNGVRSFVDIAMVNNYVWTFTTGSGSDVTLPTVISTVPVNLATGVNLNTKPTVTFSEDMDPLTINQTTFTIKQEGTPMLLMGSITYVGKVATFTPLVDFIANAAYTATITTGVEDVAGNAMANNYVWTFTTGTGTDIIPPTVISTIPVDLAKDVPVNIQPTAIFSEAMNPSTITPTSFIIKKGNQFVPGYITYVGLEARFRPLTNLTANTEYTAIVTSDVEDLAGNNMLSNYVWTFTTGGGTADITPPTVVSTLPDNQATGVALNITPSGTFSELMAPLTINSSSYTLKQGTTLVPGVVSYNGMVATYTPTNALTANTLYTATITTAVQDLAGNNMLSNYVWTFTTLNASAPTVLSTDPNNLDIDVVLNKIVNATFSEAMDPLTINETTFTLQDGSNSVTGIVSYSGTTASFEPSDDLAPNTLYTGTITTGAMNLDGTPLAADYIWTFTTVGGLAPTVVSTDPMDLDIDVALNKVISADFSEEMNSSTINTSTFTLMEGTNMVSGLVDYSGTTATLTPSDNLLSNTTYTATITTGAENLSGTPLENDYVWTFTTEEIIISPVDLGTAAPYGAFGGNAGITNQGINTIINGSIATTAASTLVTGFHDGLTGDVYTETPLNVGLVTNGIFAAPPFPGTITNEAIATQALIDANAAYVSISPAEMPGGTDPGAGELGGLTLAPGVYMSASGTFDITNGPLTLDAQGDPNATWVFQTAAGLTVGIAGPNGARSVVMINGALPKNVFWYVGSAATINGAGGGTMVGTIIASSGVTFSTPGNMVQTVLNGRAISLVASVTMVNTTINVPQD